MKERDPGAYVFAEAYEDHDGLRGAGFDAVYHDRAYDLMKRLVRGEAGPRELDTLLGSVTDAARGRWVHYLENHDERRVASPLVRHGGAV